MRAEPLSHPTPLVAPATAPGQSAQVSDFVALMKPRLSAEVLFTAAGAMWVAHRELGWQAWVLTLLGIAGTVGSANAINCVIERKSDAFMARTAGRPLPRRRITTRAAVLFAAVLGVVSVPLIALGSNVLTAALGLVALISYAFVYTPLKPRTHWAMYVGAVPGALPPLMGWAAATGAIDAVGLSLFAVLFVWQLPHFIAIAAFRKNEYLAAGLTSLPLEKGDAAAKWEALVWTVLLVPVSLVPAWLGVAGLAYVIAAAALGLWLLATTVQKWSSEAAPFWGKRVFRASLVYLTLLFIALAAS